MIARAAGATYEDLGIQQLVRTRLAAYECPRTREFVEQLPLTTTGKIRRAELCRREQEGDAVG